MPHSNILYKLTAGWLMKMKLSVATCIHILNQVGCGGWLYSDNRANFRATGTELANWQ